MEGDPEASKIVAESSLAEPSSFNYLPAGVRSCLELTQTISGNLVLHLWTKA